MIQVANLQSQVAELQRAINENGQEIKRLSESVGEQNATFKKVLQDQKLQDEALAATLKELSERVADVSTAAAVPRTVPAPVDPSGMPPTDPAAVPVGGAPPAKDLFSQAYADCSRGNYDLGIQGFREFLRVYPNTDRSDNAQYWIGECLFGKQSYPEAIEAWDQLVRDFPSTDKLPDAHVKKALAFEKLGRKKEALILYRYVVERFPNSEAAKVARPKVSPQ